MSKHSIDKGDQADHIAEPGVVPGVFESGILPLGMHARPSWSVVREYLRSGAHREWVEGYAQRSQGFARVLQMLKEDGAAGGEVIPLKR